MAKGDDKLEVVVVLVNEGYASTAVGPIEVFASAGAMWNEMQGDRPDPRFRVVTASIDGQPVESAYGLRIAPEFAIADIGAADLVMVSASGTLPEEWMSRHAALLPWLANRYRSGTLMAGVCSGVAFLAEAGLLDGRRANTPTWGVADTFRTRYPGVEWRHRSTHHRGYRALLQRRRKWPRLESEPLSGRAASAATAWRSSAPALLLGHAAPHPVPAMRSCFSRAPMTTRKGQEGRGSPQRQTSDRQIFASDGPLRNIAGMSRRNLVRRFKAATRTHAAGVLPSECWRMAAARTMLEEGAPSIQRNRARQWVTRCGDLRRIFKRHKRHDASRIS